MPYRKHVDSLNRIEVQTGKWKCSIEYTVLYRKHVDSLNWIEVLIGKWKCSVEYTVLYR